MALEKRGQDHRITAKRFSATPVIARGAINPACYRAWASNPHQPSRREFRPHFVDESVNIGKCIPRARRRLRGTDGGSHVLISMQ
jgi:hypothetical protein